MRFQWLKPWSLSLFLGLFSLSVYGEPSGSLSGPIAHESTEGRLSDERLIDIIYRYTLHKNEALVTELRELFSKVLFETLGGDKDPHNLQFTKSVETAIRVIRKKEERFERDRDLIDLLRLSLKLQYTLSFSEAEWDAIKQPFYIAFIANENTAKELQAEPLTWEQRQQIFWNTVSATMESFLHSKVSPPPVDVAPAAQESYQKMEVERMKGEFLDATKAVFEVLAKQKGARIQQGVFILALRSVLAKQQDEALVEKVSRNFEEEAAKVREEFLKKVDTGKLREQIGNLVDEIRLGLVRKGGQDHIVTIVRLDPSRPYIVAINPNFSLNQNFLEMNDPEVRRLVSRLHDDAVVWDMRSHAKKDETQARPIIRHRPFYTLPGFMDDLRATYERPSPDTIFWGVMSMVINGGTKTWRLAAASAAAASIAQATGMEPTIVFNGWAVTVSVIYFGGLSVWGKFYENVSSLFKSALSETAFKIGLGLPATFAFIELTTRPVQSTFSSLSLKLPWSEIATTVSLGVELPMIVYTVALATLATTLDKLVSVYSRRIIRFWAREGRIYGPKEIKIGSKTFHVDRPSAARELWGYFQNLINAFLQTGHAGAGIVGLFSAGLSWNIYNMKFVADKIRSYEAKRDELAQIKKSHGELNPLQAHDMQHAVASIKYYQGEQKNIKTGLLVIPGLYPAIEKGAKGVWGVTKACGRALSSLADSAVIRSPLRPRRK